MLLNIDPNRQNIVQMEADDQMGIEGYNDPENQNVYDLGDQVDLD